jgi:hypothetical protein
MVAHQRRTIIKAFPDGLVRMDWVGQMQSLEGGPVFPVKFARVRNSVQKIRDDESSYERDKIIVRMPLG